MMNKREAAEAGAIIEELTKPPPRAHAYARIVADMRLAMKHYVEDNPELINDPKAHLIIAQIIAHAGAMFDILEDYEICYREGVDYATRPANRRNDTIPPKFYGGDSANTSSSVDPRNASDNAPQRPTTTGRTNKHSVNDSGRTPGVPLPSIGKAKQRKRSRRDDAERDPTARGSTGEGRNHPKAD